MNILIAGTGILGRNLIRLYLERGEQVRAIAYSQSDFQGLDPSEAREAPQMRGNDRREWQHPNLSTTVCDVTLPETLAGVCAGIDMVISCIGITRMKGPLTHMDVDYRGNLNLLREAEKAGVKKFGFISPAGVDQGWKNVPLLEAKYHFEQALMNSSLSWVIFRAGGFMSDLVEMSRMAQKGPMFVIGSGRNHFTPVDVRDLADVMVGDMATEANRIVDVGGPEDMSWNEICRTSFEHCGKKTRILKFPKPLCEFCLWMLKPFAKSQHAMGKLIVFMSTCDLPTEKRGSRRLADVLRETT